MFLRTPSGSKNTPKKSYLSSQKTVKFHAHTILEIAI